MTIEPAYPASRFARGIALCVFVGAGLVLVGYALHIGTMVVLHDGLKGMSPLTALAAMLLAASVFRNDRPATKLSGYLALVIAAVVLASQALTGGDAASDFVSKQVFRFDLRQSGSTSIATALCIVALGIATLARTRPKVSEPAAATALVLAGYALLGYAFGVHDLYDVPLFRTMALHTALAIFALGVAVLMMDPVGGWAAVVAAPTTSGAATRRLLAFTLALPVAAWLLLRATDVHWIGPGAAMAFLVMITVVPLSLLIVKNGRTAAALRLERLATLDVQRAGDMELRRIADALPVLIAFVDRDYTYKFANRTYQDWFFVPAEQVIGRRIPELLDAQGFADRRDHMEGALAGREARFELSWPHRDGREREAEIRYIPRARPDGEIDGFHIFVSEITDRKRLERGLLNRTAALEQDVETRTRDLRTSEAKAGLYFKSSIEYLFIVRVSPAGEAVFADVNPATERLLGRAADAIIGSTVKDLIPADAAHDIELRAAQCCETGQAQTYQAYYRYVDRPEVVIDALVSPLERSDGGSGLVFFSGRDITEQLAVEEQLRQSHKMEAVGQLTGGLAHDFNNLLAGVTGSLEMMQVRLGQGRMADVHRYISAAQGATTRAAALTHRLLAFSRRQTLDPKPTNVNRLVNGMEDLVRRTVGPSIALESVGTAGLWSVLVDPPQLENALLNLCINARDAMPDGGRITVETHNKWLDERAGRERDMAPGQYVSLCVSDTGTGMPPDVVAKAFDPFFTTKPIGEGTGLGLSMIYGFARQSGGQVRIYSEVGEGTNVCIYLPRHCADEGEVDATESIEERPRAEAGETVLVVDDEPTVRMLVTDVLEDLGYTAIEASDSKAGLKILQSNVRVDLLVSDVGLPGGMNGRQMADAARVQRPDLKVLFITGYAENAVLNNGHLKPGMQVLTKPFVMETLARRIAELIGGA